ncbi:hypothetical protein J4E80_004701 [Alternaria sp. BMP 0032]|nr:hypothetical protein J4E80_004701 [Alternaria sp. BMP 0032]
MSYFDVRVREPLFQKIDGGKLKKTPTTPKEARQVAKIAEDWVPPGVFPFFRLPRELRDTIYKYALGTEARVFRADNLLLLATCQTSRKYGLRVVNEQKEIDAVNGEGSEEEEDEEDTDERDQEWGWYEGGYLGEMWKEYEWYEGRYDMWYMGLNSAVPEGLPNWLRSNKQLCSEALLCFGATRTFVIIDYYDYTNYTKAHSNPPDMAGLTNSLVMNRNVIRHIAIRREVDQLMDDDPKFLVLLQGLQVENLTMDLEWSHRLDYESDDEDSLEDCIEEWDTLDVGYWEGRLQKLKITIPTRREYGDEAFHTKTFDLAERLATRLFGPGAKVVWGPYVYDKRQGSIGLYKRYLTVEKAA